ncbi:MAG TPA: sulfite exporter TauE/SafE family protein, partial [Candidatus Acidoferrum sp.]|nr:sulfite exporter TauE/SafE family protein [Candidatus Acidoferrum sp.]
MLVGLAIMAGGVGAGLFGSLLGLGGGILIVPLLTLGFGLPLREAAGVSLVSVIITSSASAAVYLERHTANLRLGMTLELFTAIGAIVGGVLAFSLAERELAGLFAVLLLYVAVSMLRRRETAPTVAADSGGGAATTRAAPSALAARGSGETDA